MALRIVPWITDGAVGFVSTFADEHRKRTESHLRVLEFGMGASTIFFSDRSAELVSFEHDKKWYRKATRILRVLGADHARHHLAERPYSTRIEAEVGSEKFDVICIDGRDRVACLAEVLRLDLLAENGVLVLDNTERITGAKAQYAEMRGLLSGRFELIHFEQTGADRTGWTARHRWITTVAWRKNETQYTTRGIPL